MRNKYQKRVKNRKNEQHRTTGDFINLNMKKMPTTQPPNWSAVMHAQVGCASPQPYAWFSHRVWHNHAAHLQQLRIRHEVQHHQHLPVPSGPHVLLGPALWILELTGHLKRRVAEKQQACGCVATLQHIMATAAHHKRHGMSHQPPTPTHTHQDLPLAQGDPLHCDAALSLVGQDGVSGQRPHRSHHRTHGLCRCGCQVLAKVQAAHSWQV